MTAVEGQGASAFAFIDDDAALFADAEDDASDVMPTTAGADAARERAAWVAGWVGVGPVGGDGMLRHPPRFEVWAGAMPSILPSISPANCRTATCGCFFP